jgi:pimeloyl-ACP methyl ester carboxylesterase
MKKINSKTIVFITGAFVSSDCWIEWKGYFEERGYQTFAPSWPFKDAPACTLRQRHPDKDVAGQRLDKLTAYFRDFIKALPEKPILIGHSMGGPDYPAIGSGRPGNSWCCDTLPAASRGFYL